MYCMRWWLRFQLMYLELSIFKCFLNAHSRQLFGRTVRLASTHGRIFRNVPDRLHIPHVSVNTNDCEATPCFTHEWIFRIVPNRLGIPNISVTMNDCVDRLAVLYLQPWVFTLNTPDRFSKTRQPYITHKIIFTMVSVVVRFPDGSVSPKWFLIYTVCIDSIANSFVQGTGKAVSC